MERAAGALGGLLGEVELRAEPVVGSGSFGLLPLAAVRITFSAKTPDATGSNDTIAAANSGGRCGVVTQHTTVTAKMDGTLDMIVAEGTPPKSHAHRMAMMPDPTPVSKPLVWATRREPLAATGAAA